MQAELARSESRLPLRMLLIVGALTGFAPLSIDMYLPAFPGISADLDASASAVQLSLTGTLIGLAAGQVIVGPLSDRYGRRLPLFVGIAIYIAASVLCALAPNIPMLVAIRVVQGLGGAAGIVTAFAVVRDLYSGVAAARFFSVLLMLTASAPILAPLAGAGVLLVGSWRLVFVALAVLGSILLVVVMFTLPDTLAVANRTRGGIRSMGRSLWGVATDRLFLANALSGGLGYAVVFAYISGSSFVLQNVYNLSPGMYSVAFSINALGVVIGSQANALLVRRWGVSQLLGAGLLFLLAGTVFYLGCVLADVDNLTTMLIAMFTITLATGMVGPNATTLAMENFPHAAGSASATLGLLRYALGAAAAPLVGLGGAHTALPFAIVMASCAAGAVWVRAALRPRPAARPGHGEPYLALEAAVDPMP